jgi:tRNA(Met) cytidine acetyltransferase
MTLNSPFLSSLSSYQQFLAKAKQRAVALIMVDEQVSCDDCLSNLKKLINCYDDAPWQYRDQGGSINRRNFRDHLGQECTTLVFEQDIFDIEAFTALSGTVIAGGIIFIIVPKKTITSMAFSAFFKRFYSMLLLDTNTITIQYKAYFQFTQLPLFVDENSSENNTAATDHKKLCWQYNCVTQEQQQAVEAIIKVSNGRRNRPLVLTADRGRGKSSALALAVVQLLTQTNSAQNIIITAPKKSVLQVFYQQLKQHLPELEVNKENCSYQQHQITFKAIDALLIELPPASLVLVDEAAGIPVPLLVKLAKQYHRMVFSTTVHGYEGAGRGFALTFLKQLAAIQPSFTQLHISEPIRWRKEDPVEQLIFNICLLNAQIETTADITQNIANASLKMAVITSETLLADELILRQIFAILVNAHYQTSPNDLQLLLENPACKLIVAYHNELVANKIVAVCLVLQEGKAVVQSSTDSQLVSAIAKGQRRIKDQFLPQALLAHQGFSKAFEFSYLRIMRIAVIPELQGEGIGSFLLQQLAIYAEQENIDFIGSSFAINKQLWLFWQKQHYSITRLGFTKDQASGEHSALILKGMNKLAKVHEKQLQSEFYRQFSYLLTDEYSQLDSMLVTEILASQPRVVASVLTKADWQTVKAFATGARQYSQSVFALHLWLIEHCANCEYLTRDIYLLISRILQKKSIEQCCKMYGLTGKKAVNQAIVAYIQQHL